MKLPNSRTLAFLILLIFPLILHAQTGGKISGKVTYSADNISVHDADVQIVQLKRSVKTGDDGSFLFENVPPGRYTIRVHMEGFSDVSKTVEVTLGATVNLDFSLEIAGVRAQVNVTASGSDVAQIDSFQSVGAVNSNVLAQRASSSLGEVLDGESGVSKRSFGEGSSRPVIRGFDGDRVLVAQDGVRSGSLGSQSGDHGETVDTLSAERVEIVKGPATLLYGSNAIGGVVNVISTHDQDVHSGFRGFGTFVGGTNTNQLGGSGGLEYGFGKWMIFGNGSYQNANNYHTPIQGEILHSASRSGNVSGGFGYYDKKFFFTSNLDYDNRRYGIPFAAFIESGGLEDGETELTVKNYNYKATGGLRDLQSFIESTKFTFNYTRYRHSELEDGAINSTFHNNTTSYRGVFEQKKYKSLTGRFGFDGFNRNYGIVGTELLIVGDVRHNSFAAFGLEQLEFKRISFQFGGRVEHNGYNPVNPELLDRSFTGFSGSVGAKVRLWEGGLFVANFITAYRSPALEELYNNGPHVGTVSFEVGNQNLQRERTNGIDFSLRHASEKTRFEANYFYYRISNYIYLARVDEDHDGFIDVEDNLPVAAYSQGLSEYYGGEITFDADINKYLSFFTGADIVRAKLVDLNQHLPRIPPAHAKIGIDLKYKDLSVRPEGTFVSSQERLFPLETRTPGYGLFDVTANYTIGKQHYAHIFGVVGYNLLNREYRNHLSFIKDLAPEIGRGVRFTYTVRFF